MKPCRSLYVIRQPAVCLRERKRETGKEMEGWVYVPELINLPPFLECSRTTLQAARSEGSKRASHFVLDSRSRNSIIHFLRSRRPPHSTLCFSLSLPLIFSYTLHLYRHPFSTAVTRAVSSSPLGLNHLPLPARIFS